MSLISYYPYASTTRSNVVLRLTNSRTQPSGSSTTTYSPVASDPAPTTTADYMQFNGTSQIIRFIDRPEWHFTPPYSIELEMFADAVDGARWVATDGEGFNKGWPEWSIVITGGGLQFNSSTTNNGDTTSQWFMPTISTSRWYKIGIMYYTDSSNAARVRGYVNSAQVFDTPCGIPYDTSNQLAFGGDAAVYSSRLFKGRLRNITMGQSLFWTV